MRITSDFITVEAVCADPKLNKNTAKAYKNIFTKLPDLMFYKTVDGMCLPCSNTVTPIADTVEFGEERNLETGTLNVWAWPSAIIDDVKVFTGPPYYWLGESNPNGFGIVPNPDIEKSMAEDNMPHKVVKQIREYYRDHPAISYL